MPSLRVTDFPRALVCMLVAGSLAGSAAAQPVTFRKVVDTDTTVPGGIDTFEGLDHAALDDGNVAFAGWSPSAVGVYREVAGALQVVADGTTPAPGTTSTFTYFYELSYGGGTIAFRAATTGDPMSEVGIYATSGGAIEVVVDETTISPIGAYYEFFDPVVDGEDIYFHGRRGSRGIHRFTGGGIEVAFDGSHVQMPGGTSELDGFRWWAGGGGLVLAGHGMWNETGVYRVRPDGSLEVVADWRTPVPGSADLFDAFSWAPAVDVDRVVFTGSGASSYGVYVHEGGALSALVDQNTPVPGMPGETFVGFGSLSIDGSATAYEAWEPGGSWGRQAIYVDRGGQLQRVIGESDVLEGRVVQSLILRPEGLEGDAVAFLATFGDFEQGIYVATLPPLAPTVPALPALPVVLLVATLVAVGRRASRLRAIHWERSRARRTGVA